MFMSCFYFSQNNQSKLKSLKSTRIVAVIKNEVTVTRYHE